jgi:hypothetical protein
MPDLSVGTPPWSFAFNPIDRTRIVVVANTSSSWSRSACEYYCAARGIPQNNIVDVTVGTNDQWSPASVATIITDFYQPVHDKLLAVNATGVLMGPDTPKQILLPLYVSDGASGYMPGSGSALAPLYSLAGAAKNAIPDAFCVLATNGPQNTAWGWDATTKQVTPIGSRDHNVVFGGNYGTSNFVTYTTPDSTGGVLSFNVVNAETTALVNGGSLFFLPAGCIGGWQSWETDPPLAETEERVLALIDRASAAMASTTSSTARQRNTVVQIGSLAGIEYYGWAVLVWLMKSWGMGVQYYYHGGITPTGMYASTYAPLSGAVATWSQVQTGLATPVEYYWRIGTDANEMSASSYAAPWATNFAPIPSQGHSTVIGASFGHYSNLYDVSSQNGVAGVTDLWHRTSSVYNTFSPARLHNLMRGMSYLEAGYYNKQVNAGVDVPFGDPLFTPFPLNSPSPGVGSSYSSQTVRRNVATSQMEAVVAQHTRPVDLVHLGFAGQDQYLSSGSQVTWEGNNYLEGMVRVGNFSWTPDGEHNGSVTLLNENNAAASLVLSLGVRDVPVDVYKAHLDATGAVVGAELVFSGVIESDEISYGEVTLQVSVSRSRHEYVPNSYFVRRTNYLTRMPRPGRLIRWGTETYRIEGEE